MATTIEAAFVEFAEVLTTPSGEASAEAGHRASIKQCLENQFGMTHFFQSGSFGFGTNVPGQSDVDRFAVIPAGNISPNSWMALRQIVAALRGRFSDTKVVIDKPAVRISFSGGADATEVIPALDVTPYGNSSHRIFRIPDGKGGWTQSSPESHKQLIAEVDERYESRLKPLIRFVKAWKYFKKVQVSSFYLELSVAEFASRQSNIYYPFHVPGVFGFLWQERLKPVEDPMGISGSLKAAQPAQRNDALTKLRAAKALSQRALIYDIGGQVEKSFSDGTFFTETGFPLLADKEMGDTIQELVTEAQRLGEDDCLHSEKGHLVAARVWRVGGHIAGILVTVFGAVIGVIVFNKWDAVGILGTLAIVVAAVSALTTLLNPQARAQTHHARGNDYSALRGKLRRFAIIRCRSGESETKLADMLEDLAGERHSLNQQGPPVPTWAYRLAKRGIKRGEADYAVDKTMPGD